MSLDKGECPICYRNTIKFYGESVYKHLQIYHEPEELARFICFGKEANDKILLTEEEIEE